MKLNGDLCDTHKRSRKLNIKLQGASEITANLYCYCVHLYWEGGVICSIGVKGGKLILDLSPCAFVSR